MKDIKTYITAFKCEKCNREFNRKCSISKHFAKYHQYSIDEIAAWKKSVDNISTFYEKEFYVKASCTRVKTMSSVAADGLTGFKRIGNKVRIALLKKDESGKTLAQRVGKLTGANRKLNGGYASVSMKNSAHANRIESNGKTMAENRAAKSAITRKNTIMPSGITLAQHCARKGFETKRTNGYFIPLSLYTEFEQYKIKVNTVTKLNKKLLFELWNGQDYYDQEYIKDNFKYIHTDPNYPTIDHKISIKYGFLHNINPDTIGDISNLCITKRSINSSKRELTEENFINNIS